MPARFPSLLLPLPGQISSKNEKVGICHARGRGSNPFSGLLQILHSSTCILRITSTEPSLWSLNAQAWQCLALTLERKLYKMCVSCRAHMLQLKFIPFWCFLAVSEKHLQNADIVQGAVFRDRQGSFAFMSCRAEGVLGGVLTLTLFFSPLYVKLPQPNFPSALRLVRTAQFHTRMRPEISWVRKPHFFPHHHIPCSSTTALYSLFGKGSGGEQEGENEGEERLTVKVQEDCADWKALCLPWGGYLR